MNAVFADTSYWIALLLPADQHHARAVSVGGQQQAMITTQVVLAELDAAFARAPLRHLFVALMETITADSGVNVVSADDELFHAGFELFRCPTDKDWSLTDCISFIVMRRMGITDALTADLHFEQAGFTALLQ